MLDLYTLEGHIYRLYALQGLDITLRSNLNVFDEKEGKRMWDELLAHPVIQNINRFFDHNEVRKSALNNVKHPDKYRIVRVIYECIINLRNRRWSIDLLSKQLRESIDYIFNNLAFAGLRYPTNNQVTEDNNEVVGGVVAPPTALPDEETSHKMDADSSVDSDVDEDYDLYHI